MELVTNNKNPKANKRWAVIFPLVLILVGIAVILLGYFTINKSNDWIKTTGTISDIVRDYGTEGKINYKAYVDYFVNGQKIEHILLDAFENFFQLGITINIKYNPANLSQITYDKQAYFSVLYIVGAVISGIGVLIAIFVSPKIFKQENEKCK